MSMFEDLIECRGCGCTDVHACMGADGLPCHWVEPDLCSNCAATAAQLLCPYCGEEVNASWVPEELRRRGFSADCNERDVIFTRDGRALRRPFPGELRLLAWYDRLDILRLEALALWRMGWHAKRRCDLGLRVWYEEMGDFRAQSAWELSVYQARLGSIGDFAQSSDATRPEVERRARHVAAQCRDYLLSCRAAA